MNWQMVKFFIRSLKFIWCLKVRFLISTKMNILHGTGWVHGWVARRWWLRLCHHRAVVAVVGIVRLNELKELDVRVVILLSIFSILILSFQLNYLEVLILDESMAFLKASRQKADVFHPLLVKYLDDASQHPFMVLFDIVGAIIGLTNSRHRALAKANLLSLVVVFGHFLLRQADQANVILLGAVSDEVSDLLLQVLLITVVIDLELRCTGQHRFLL